MGLVHQGPKKYPEDARIFIRLLRYAIRENESTGYILCRAQQCMMFGVTKHTVRTIIRNGFRKHIMLLAEEGALVPIAFVIAKAIRCLVDRWFLTVSLRVAMNRAFAEFLPRS